MTNNNSLQQRRNETLEDYIARVKSMTSEELSAAVETQRTQVLESYRKASKPSSYKRKVYHK